MCIYYPISFIKSICFLLNFQVPFMFWIIILLLNILYYSTNEFIRFSNNLIFFKILFVLQNSSIFFTEKMAHKRIFASGAVSETFHTSSAPIIRRPFSFVSAAQHEMENLSISLVCQTVFPLRIAAFSSIVIFSTNFYCFIIVFHPTFILIQHSFFSYIL
mgnify:CR=1 FL=1